MIIQQINRKTPRLIDGLVFLASLAAVSIVPSPAASAQWRTAYYEQSNDHKLPISAIPFSKYTHVIQFTVRPTYSGGACTINFDSDGVATNAAAFINAAHAAGAKALFSMLSDYGGSAITACTSAQHIDGFVASIKNFVETKGYDGFDFDWEDGINVAQYKNWILKMRAAMPNKILTAAVNWNERAMLAQVQNSLDQINFMNYDKDRAFVDGNGATVALFNTATRHGSNSNWVSAQQIYYYMVTVAGISPAKLGLGLPFYGLVKTGCRAGYSNCSQGVSSIGHAYASGDAWTNPRTPIAYNDLLKSVYWTGGTKVWDATYGAQYISYDVANAAQDAFVPYTDAQQIQEIVNYGNSVNVGGYMTFSLDYEYLSAKSGDDRYPLSMALVNAMTPAAVDIAPGTSIQSVVNAHPAGTTYVLKAGVHRMQAVAPKNGDVFRGEQDASGRRLTVLSGARLLTSFAQSGSYWVASGQTQEDSRRVGECVSGYSRCAYPEDVFMDDQPLRHVASLAEVGPGKYFFDYAADKIYIGDNPSGRKVEASATATAFVSAASGVTVESLIVEKYASPAQVGAIGGPKTAGPNWIVRNNEVRYNHGVGIISAAGMKIIGNKIHHNGELGLGGSGTAVLVENNEIYDNAYYPGYNMAWEGGAFKFTYTDGLIVRGNHSHHNNGSGMWTDIDNINTLYENNLVEYNNGTGIFHEISYKAIIRNNVVRYNEAASSCGWLWCDAILISSSENVEVTGNQITIDSNRYGHGIMLVQQARGTGNGQGNNYSWEPCSHSPNRNCLVRNNYVHHNTITIIGPNHRGVSGGVQDFTSATVPNIFSATANNRFDYNTYYVRDPNAPFWAWDNNFRDWAGFRSLGQELNGVLRMGSRCDLNGDGQTTVNDVQLSVNQALGSSACTADINQDGRCDVLDVQRIAIAALGGACTTP